MDKGAIFLKERKSYKRRLTLRCGQGEGEITEQLSGVVINLREFHRHGHIAGVSIGHHLQVAAVIDVILRRPKPRMSNIPDTELADNPIREFKRPARSKVHFQNFCYLSKYSYYLLNNKQRAMLCILVYKHCLSFLF